MTYALVFIGVARAAENLLLWFLLLILFGIVFWAVSMAVFFAYDTVSGIGRHIWTCYRQSRRK